MTDYEKGRQVGKSSARYYNSLSEIEAAFGSKGKEFLKGFVLEFDKYWINKLMGDC